MEMDLSQKEIKGVGERRYYGKKNWVWVLTIVLVVVGIFLIAVSGGFATDSNRIHNAGYQVVNGEETMELAVNYGGEVVIDGTVWQRVTEKDSSLYSVTILGLLILLGSLVVLVVNAYYATEAGKKLLEEIVADSLVETEVKAKR